MEATPLPFLHVIEKLKYIQRTGWVNHDIPNPETVAAHSYRVAIMAMLVPENSGIDMPKCMQMALIHDLGESIIGDIPTSAKVPKERKYAMESNGFRYLQNLLRAYSPKRAEYMNELFKEFEDGETDEAKWVKEMDKLECLIQAVEYEQKTFGEKDLEEFQGQKQAISSEEAKKWVESLSRERRINRARLERRLPIIFIMGDSEVSEKIGQDVSSELSLPHIPVNKIACERAQDPNFVHHNVIQTCLERGFDLPADLVIELIERKLMEMEERGDRRWTIISGFPKDKEQLEVFEQKIQRSNYAIRVESTLRTDHPTQTASKLNEAMQEWKPSAIKFEEALKSSMRHFTELKMPVPEKELCEMTAIVVKALIQGSQVI